MDSTIQDYFNMGIDREGEDLRQYVFQVEMSKTRNSKQPITCWILRDKWVTARYLQTYGLATTRPLFVKTPFISQQEAIDILRNSGETRFFAKYVDMAQGKGAFPFSLKGEGFEAEGKDISATELIDKLEDCIVEPYIEQHDAMKELYPHAVSSLRIITVCENGKIEVILSFLLMGAGGTHASNLHQGGLRLPINTNGELDELGIRMNEERGWYKSHPDTGVVFKGFKIPFWKEAVELAIRAHKCFPKIHSVGWDIAISKDGPLIIEGNQHWIPHTFQYTNGPGRKLMEKYFLQ